jgi:hypothetical protein
MERPASSNPASVDASADIPLPGEVLAPLQGKLKRSIIQWTRLFLGESPRQVDTAHSASHPVHVGKGHRFES